MQKYSIVEGVLRGAQQLPSPNFNLRPAQSPVELLVIHNISLPAGEFGGGHIQRFFQNNLDYSAHPSFSELEGLYVSAHLLITREGEVIQFVNFNWRAWHAGVSNYLNRNNCNDFSIGIELEGTDDCKYTEIQYRVLAEISALIQKHYPRIDAQSTVAHSEIAPGRKTDPGPYFSWREYRQLWSELLSDS
ncbi:MAG: 1,6-anhydro-N-acetylmuramyl-L-alanine amidase AmpD [Pseudomonadales bacterium]|nr:1,6-anhydro-N-acetylmuramyl-L-alanine amidase AmpD [Pseudomonadales bacterium]NRA16350.1 1,6-anhydro-N-acetylmuramyl-L-alanine amidase AmpD [Oceanospirillaceae bacterium]